MKRLLIVTAFLALTLGFASHASAYDCRSYYDMVATAGFGTTYCTGYGAVCWNCANALTGANCSSNWDPCNPDQHGPIFDRVRLSVPNVSPQARTAERTRKQQAARLNASDIV